MEAFQAYVENKRLAAGLHWTVIVLTKLNRQVDQRAITKEKKHLNIFKYIHYKHNQREYEASFQSS